MTKFEVTKMALESLCKEAEQHPTAFNFDQANFIVFSDIAISLAIIADTLRGEEEEEE